MEHQEIFCEGREVAYFSSLAELVEKVRYYLRHDGERHRVAEAAYRKGTTGNHTYAHWLRVLRAMSRLGFQNVIKRGVLEGPVKGDLPLVAGADKVALGRGRAERPFRVAIVLSNPGPHFSPLFRRLAQRPDIDLTVLYSTLAGALPAKDPNFGLTMAWDVPLLEGYKFKRVKRLRRGGSGGFWDFASPGVITELWRGHYDVVIVYGWGNVSVWLAIVAARLANIPCLITGDTNYLYQKDISWLKAQVKKAVLRTLFRHIQAFLVTGPFNRMFYESYGVSDRRLFFAPFAVDNDYFMRGVELARPRRNEIRARYGIPPDIVLLLFVGKLLPQKRPLDIVFVLKDLQADFPNLGAVWVGDGEARPQLEAEIAKQRVKHAFALGFKNQSELPEIYAMSDVFVLPFWHGTVPLAVNEALASGLPVIASNRTGVWGAGSLVRYGETGFVYPAADTAALSEAVRKLVDDPKLRRTMGKRGTEVVQEFGLDRCVDGILDALWFVVRR